MSVIRGDAELLAICQSIFDDLDEIEKGCQDRIEEGEHPEWHIYEIAESDARSEVWQLLQDAGCIRIGKVNDRMCFEGRKKAISDATDVIRSICGDIRPNLEHTD